VLVSYCFYTAIYNQSPVGLSVPSVWSKTGKSTFDEKLDRVLQEIAWEAVKAEPLSGVVSVKK